ncbi:MAG: 16S rRNA (cytidine(1402)-2'-O)-methyltransferase [Clostridiales bacterium]|nr:16S rRNA (cytidine(1402)-2'-O)-methyltransferase [Clostridiales bacterium]
MPGMLYLVPTPIGNLQDISPRMRQALEDADFIGAEDTRVTLKLLNHLGIKRPLLSYYDHNRAAAGQKILARLLEGQVCALVSDAGTPAISDPGEDLVALCVEHGIPVSAIPGPCAAITALCMSGLPTGRFTFEGFLTVNRKNRREHLASLRSETRTMIFYEAPHKLRSTLEDLMDTFGAERRISLCREMTKLHEEVLRMTLGQACAHYASQEPRGEYVLILEGAALPEAPQATEQDALEQIRSLQSQGLSLKDAAKQVSAALHLPKNQLYALALQKKGESQTD